MPKPKRIYVQFVNVNDLKPAPFNPSFRTSEKATKDLVRSMNEKGFLNTEPIKITRDNYIADGHRRWTVAKKLGITYIPALVTHLNLDEAWATSQEATRPVSTKEVMEAQLRGLKAPLRNSVGKNLTYYTNKYGEDIIRYVYEHGKSIPLIQVAERVYRYVGWNEDSISLVLRWIIENKMSNLVQLIIAQGVLKDALREKIENNEPIKFEDSLLPVPS